MRCAINDLDRYYSPVQAAHILRVTPARIRQLLQGGELEEEPNENGPSGRIPYSTADL